VRTIFGQGSNWGTSPVVSAPLLVLRAVHSITARQQNQFSIIANSAAVIRNFARPQLYPAVLFGLAIPALIYLFTRIGAAVVPAAPAVTGPRRLIQHENG
jgi:hypothetical protein